MEVDLIIGFIFELANILMSNSECNKFKPLKAPKKHRKRYVALDQRTKDICIEMAMEGKTAEDISKYSGQSHRSARRIIQRLNSCENKSVLVEKFFERKGPMPASNEQIITEIKEAIASDNSLTIRGKLIANH